MSLRQNILSALGGVDKQVYNKTRRIHKPAGHRNLSSTHRAVISKTKTQTNINSRSIPAGQVTRLTSDWLGQTQTFNSLIRGGISRIRSRARDLVVSDSHAKKYIRLLERSVVGPKGFIMRSEVTKIEITDNGLQKIVKDVEVNRMIEAAWKQFNNKKFATIRGNISFRRLCQLVVSNTARDGEVFLIKVPYKNKFGFTFQLLEGDYCDETFNTTLSNGNVVVMGVEIDQYRRVQAYWFSQPTPQMESYGNIRGERKRVPADQVIHVFVKESANQLRGLSWFTPVAVRLKMLAAYEEASLVAARVAAAKAIVLKKANPQAPSPTRANIAGAREVGNDKVVSPISPGEAWFAPDGYDVINWTPTSPNEKQEPFAQHNLRAIASGWDISFINLANDYSQVNYTSSRTNLLEERDAFEDLQTWCDEEFLSDVSEFWLEMTCLTGTLPKEWLFDFDQYYNIAFKGRTWKWVDPEKTANANIKENLNNMKTLKTIYDEQGLDWEDELEQLSYENDFLIERGLRREVQQVVVVGEADEPEDENEEEDNDKEKHYETSN